MLHRISLRLASRRKPGMRKHWHRRGRGAARDRRDRTRPTEGPGPMGMWMERETKTDKVTGSPARGGPAVCSDRGGPRAGGQGQQDLAMSLSARDGGGKIHQRLRRRMGSLTLFHPKWSSRRGGTGCSARGQSVGRLVFRGGYCSYRDRAASRLALEDLSLRRDIRDDSPRPVPRESIQAGEKRAVSWPVRNEVHILGVPAAPPRFAPFDYGLQAR